MKPIKWHWSDLASIKTSLLGYLTLLATAILVAAYANNMVEALQLQHRQAMEQKKFLNQAETSIRQLNHLKRLPAYQRLHHSSHSTVSPRLTWIGYFDQLYLAFPSNNLRFDLSPEEMISFSLAPESLTEVFYQTPVVFHAEVNHESALLDLLSHLLLTPGAATVIDRCSIERLPLDEAHSSERLKTTCHFRLVYLLNKSHD